MVVPLDAQKIIIIQICPVNSIRFLNGESKLLEASFLCVIELLVAVLCGHFALYIYVGIGVFVIGLSQISFSLNDLVSATAVDIRPWRHM